MKLGLLVEAEEGLAWEHWRGIYGSAERLGLDSVWISDHLRSPWSSKRHGLEPWTALAVAGAETGRLRLGSLVSPITFHEPAVLARAAESIQALSHGRLVLGLGLGWNADEHAAFGIQFPSVAERTRRLETALVRMREMLGESVPLLLGGGGARATLPLVARYADAWNLTTASAKVFAERLAALLQLCEANGRDPASLERSIAAGVLIGADADDLEMRAARVQALVEPLQGHPLEDVPDAARAMGWLVGTPAEVVAKLHGLAAAGVDLAILGLYDHSDMQALELIASQVLPRVSG